MTHLLTLRNLKLVITYEGTDFSGWQYQKEGRTVQASIEEAVERITGERLRVIGAGRTDAGVHALRQVANFKTLSTIPTQNLKRALNSLLPQDLKILEIEEVPLEFHARHSAKAKVYEYRVLSSEAPDVLRRRFVWQIPYRLRDEFLRASLKYIVGEHDFSSFRSTGSGVKSPVRTMYEADLRVEGELYRFIFRANGFLRHMVRNIVGTLVQMSLKERTPEEFLYLLEKRDRTLAGPKAPPQGLYLVEVIY
ncbi:MAG: tRNA pseudouridine(38-40) synthase TruA [Desulfatiglandales bacterium]